MSGVGLMRRNGCMAPDRLGLTFHPARPKNGLAGFTFCNKVDGWRRSAPNRKGPNVTDLEHWTEAVARAIYKIDGWHPEFPFGTGSMWHQYELEAETIVLALAPLVIERCAEVAKDYDTGASEDEYEDGANDTAAVIAADIRALKTAITEAGAKPPSPRTVSIPEDDVVAAYRGLLVLATMCRRAGLTAGYETAVDIEKRLQAAHPALMGLAVLRTEAGRGKEASDA
jgi:hypothetical protein